MKFEVQYYNKQGSRKYGASSQADFIQNYFLQKHMFPKRKGVSLYKNTIFGLFWSILGPT